MFVVVGSQLRPEALSEVKLTDAYATPEETCEDPLEVTEIHDGHQTASEGASQSSTATSKRAQGRQHVARGGAR